MVVWKKLAGSKGYSASVPGLGDIHVSRAYQVTLNDKVMGYYGDVTEALNEIERIAAETQREQKQ